VKTFPIMMFTLQILMWVLPLSLATSKENIYVDTNDLTFPVLFSGKCALLFFCFFVIEVLGSLSDTHVF
jgi:hypothetical protein